jgi:hypothetical protein
MRKGSAHGVRPKSENDSDDFQAADAIHRKYWKIPLDNATEE